MPPPGALCIKHCLNYKSKMVVQRDNANDIIEIFYVRQGGRNNPNLMVCFRQGEKIQKDKLPKVVVLVRGT